MYHGRGRPTWEPVRRPKPAADTDAIVRVDAFTICGTDLHILTGDVPEVDEGRVLGHEGVGTVVEIGPAVREVSVGDRVLISCISACGTCPACRRQRYGQCSGGGGWLLGHTIDGTQAQFVRVPFADTSTHPIPPRVSDEEVLMLADIVPTAYEVGVLNARVSPGQSVAVVGAGPIGLSVIQSARLFSAGSVIAVDVAGGRLDAAKRFGADVTLNGATADIVHEIGQITGGVGVDVAVEAVGTPETFELCTRIVRPGGHVANVGVHGKPATLHLERLWAADLTITTGLVDTFSTPTLLGLLDRHLIDTAAFITHRFTTDHLDQAYDTFARAGETHALKVVVTA